MPDLDTDTTTSVHDTRLRSDEALRLTAITKRHPGPQGTTRAAADGIDLTARRSEIFGLLGPTGAGRATTIQTLAGLRRSTSGTVRILRVVMVTAQAVALPTMAVAPEKVEAVRLPALFGIAFLGLTVFGGVDYPAGGRLASPDATTNVGTLIQLAAPFLSDPAFPRALMPDDARTVLGPLPGTFFGDPMLTRMPNGSPQHPV
ncbi:ATP-binding cassette domain-containing protein [Streptomyces sp. MRC013]|uniref:ATP-binding cassette domain-containing protein n=1 Tax=Streptomyces sp. MRC013 TaxID=2898276 RepID=UPI002026DDBF|nr:ATP-binding cassette domain-containing protein [Streptomyces sp. MRC013]URM92524.1 ATP-binding cassette domain-containing protein [Streptomyces sp. MRC013]